MKIVIFGATGMTGLCAVEAAVKKGYEVRAFVRDPDLLPVNLRSQVEVVKGNVLEPDSVYDAVRDTEGVVIVLGTRNNLDPTSDMSEGTKNIIDSMRQSNINKLSVCLSAFLFYEPDKVPPRFIGLNDDHKRMLEAVKSSGLDWVAVLPPHISDDPSREVIIEVNPEKSPGRAITKHDLGSFLVNCLSQPKYYKSLIGIANVPKE